MTATALLREQVDLRQGPDDGTIVSFSYVFDLETKKKHRKAYTYVAVWIEEQGRWYLSGLNARGHLGETLEHTAFLGVLARPNTRKAWVMTGRERFKP